MVIFNSNEWRRVVDTARSSPEDIVEPGTEPILETASYSVRARSVVVLRREQGPPLTVAVEETTGDRDHDAGLEAREGLATAATGGPS